ncbi:MAG TPA: FkbM family methyltransferase [Candidatus Acidoferrum sp.]|nr:FkbM family methyltransferase [Candidatus Acidoferrum sp.]
MSTSIATPNGSAWKRISHRFAVGSYALRQGLSNLSVDLMLLLHRGQDRVVLRQKQLDRFQMIVRADEEVGREIYYGGVHESAETTFLRSRVERTSICCDIGANVGYYSLLFASHAREGAVHSFEPVPLNFYVLCTNRLLNHFSNLTANPCAVGDSNGSVRFVVSRDSAFSSLVNTGIKPMAMEISVPITRLDAYCEANGLGTIDVLKVDVEGAEGKVLAGATRLFSDPARRPRTVMLELYEPMLIHYRSSIDQILSQMEGFGYRPFVFASGRLVRFQLEHYNRLYNVIFLNE